MIVNIQYNQFYKMSYGSIYKIQFPNRKHYIGLTTTSLEQRKTEHKYCAKNTDTKCILYNALRKYDMIDTFELIEIDTADTLEELYKKEIHYILEYNSYYKNENGYNMTYGGDGTHGYIFTEEDNKKNSERMKKYYENNTEAKKKHSEGLKKYYENPESREKNSEKLKKHYENPDAREKCSKAQKKRFENPEEGKHHSEKMKKHFENPESRIKSSESLKKYYQNPESREKSSKAQKKRFENPESTKKNSEAMKKYYQEHPEAKEQIGIMKKKYYEEHPEEKEKLSIIHKKYYENNTEAKRKLSDGKGKNKPFDIFTLDGTFVKTFNYQFEAREFLQKEYNITTTINISDVLSGKGNYSAGFVFKYK